MRVWVSDFANAVTLIGFVGSVGFSGVLGIFSPAILQPILGLPVALRVVLGICIFLVALTLMLAGLKAVLERRSQGKAAQNAAPQSSDYQLWQELKRVESENEQLRTALQQNEQAYQEARNWVSTITPFMHRMQLRFALQAILRYGNNLREMQKPDVAAMEKWVSLTSAAIRKYLGDESANFFLAGDGDTSFDARLQRLEQLFDKPVDEAGELQSEFDLAEIIEPYPSEWNSKYKL